MWPFRKKTPAPQRTPMENAQSLCDIANQLMPDLPKGVSFWMDWSTRPPQLTLRERCDGKRVY